MSKLVRIKRNDGTMSWEAICPDCKKLVFMVTAEAVFHGPRRPSGSSLLLPATMSAPHESDSPK